MHNRLPSEQTATATENRTRSRGSLSLRHPWQVTPPRRRGRGIVFPPSIPGNRFPCSFPRGGVPGGLTTRASTPPEQNSQHECCVTFYRAASPAQTATATAPATETPLAGEFKPSSPMASYSPAVSCKGNRIPPSASPGTDSRLHFSGGEYPAGLPRGLQLPPSRTRNMNVALRSTVQPAPRRLPLPLLLPPPPASPGTDFPVHFPGGSTRRVYHAGLNFPPSRTRNMNVALRSPSQAATENRTLST